MEIGLFSSVKDYMRDAAVTACLVGCFIDIFYLHYYNLYDHSNDSIIISNAERTVFYMVALPARPVLFAFNRIFEINFKNL